MKQDLKALFKGSLLKEKELPMNHREEFISKLTKKSVRKSKKWNSFYITNIAASFLILCTVGFAFLYQNTKSQSEITNKINLQTQIKEIEVDYLKNIENEWNNFLALSKDQKLIDRFEQKLEELNLDYQEISLKYKKSPDNILIIEDLISNLSTRLQLLKDIQEHIIILNQTNAIHETINI